MIYLFFMLSTQINGKVRCAYVIVAGINVFPIEATATKPVVKYTFVGNKYYFILTNNLIELTGEC